MLTFIAFLYIEQLDRILFKPYQKMFMMYIIMSETFMKIDSLQYL